MKTMEKVPPQNLEAERAILGAIMIDRDAILTDFQFEGSASSPLEARKQYRNIWWHFSKNAINDPTENAVLFYMDDPAEGSNTVGSAIVGTAEAGD